MRRTLVGTGAAVAAALGSMTPAAATDERWVVVDAEKSPVEAFRHYRLKVYTLDYWRPDDAPGVIRIYAVTHPPTARAAPELEDANVPVLRADAARAP